MYDQSMTAVHDHLMKRTPDQQLLYTTEFLNVLFPPSGQKPDVSAWRVEHKQDHLVCFLGGSLMLGATEARTEVPPKDQDFSAKIPTAVRDWNSGKDLIKTCMATHETETGLASEIVMFYDNKPVKMKGGTQSTREWYIKGGKTSQLLDARYILRPETVESLFIAFRLTGDPVYRQHGWRIFRAIEKHCKIPEQQGGGYASIRNVDRAEGFKGWEDKMETFFLAETLKYLFLLFSDTSIVPLKDFVFNTEAHPLPVFSPSQELIDLVEF